MDGNRIHVYLHGDDQAPVPYLLGRIFALWLELRGFPLLHGCTASVAGKAVGFLGDSHAGKTTLGAAMVRHGHRLLTDDLIPLWLQDHQFTILPGIPMSRIWPDTGEHLVANFEHAQRIHPKGEKRKVFHDDQGQPRFSEEPAPLHTLFLLERREEQEPPRLEPVSPASSLLELVRTSYRPELVEAVGLQPGRLKLMAALPGKVHIMRLQYPTGFQHLTEVISLIESHLGA